VARSLAFFVYTAYLGGLGGKYLHHLRTAIAETSFEILPEAGADSSPDADAQCPPPFGRCLPGRFSGRQCPYMTHYSPGRSAAGFYHKTAANPQ
jgi:hypothetical protein